MEHLEAFASNNIGVHAIEETSSPSPSGGCRTSGSGRELRYGNDRVPDTSGPAMVPGMAWYLVPGTWILAGAQLGIKMDKLWYLNKDLTVMSRT